MQVLPMQSNLTEALVAQRERTAWAPWVSDLLSSIAVPGLSREKAAKQPQTAEVKAPSQAQVNVCDFS